MKSEDDLDRELDRLVQRLPELLRDEWAVIPKREITEISIACLLIGAAAATAIVGMVFDIPGLKWSWPLVVGGLVLATRLWPRWRGDRHLEQLREVSRAEAGSTGGERPSAP